MDTYRITGYDEVGVPFRLVKNNSVVIFESWTLGKVWDYMREIVRSDHNCLFTDGKDTIPGLRWLAQMVYAGFIQSM